MAFRPTGSFRIGPSDSVLWSRPNGICIGNYSTRDPAGKCVSVRDLSIWRNWLDFQCLCCDGTWRTWTWRRLLTIILTQKSLHKAWHISQVSVYILSIVNNWLWPEFSCNERTGIEDSAGQKMDIQKFTLYKNIKIITFAWCVVYKFDLDCGIQNFSLITKLQL